jgi:hypothetical protein
MKRGDVALSAFRTPPASAALKLQEKSWRREKL